jgi:hypothetical protein
MEVAVMPYHSHTIMTVAVMFGLALSLLACSGESAFNEVRDANGVPRWVSEGSNIVKSQQSRRFYGVGSASMLGDFSLQTATADSRARAEIVRILTSYMEIVSLDFIASGKAAEAGFSEQNVLSQIDAVVGPGLGRVNVVSHWNDKKTKKIYAIAELDMQRVRRALAAAVLNPGLKAYIGIEGDNIFDRIAKSED